MFRESAVVLCSLLLVVAGAAPVAATSTAESAQTGGYAGTHVAFDTSSNAVVDYAVDGETVVESMTVQSQSEAQESDGISLDLSLSAVTNLTGAAVSLDSQSAVGATLTTESGATVNAHDSSHGVMVVGSGSQSQYVQANLSSEATVESESDSRVAVTTGNGTEGAFVVAGEGEVAANEDDNVSADLAEDANLVFRAYTDSRDDDDRAQEQMIANGTAAAEAYVTESSDSSGELAAGVANYTDDTAVEVTGHTEGTVSMTAERSQSEGRVIITSVSEAAIESTEDLQVTVDGEAAAQASSHAELQNAIGGNTSKYMVSQSSAASASANADVLVAVNEFSTRNITMSEDGSGDGAGTTTNGDDSDGDGEGDTTTDGSDDSSDTTTDTGDGGGGFTPGFGAGVALIGALAAALIAARRL